MELDILLDDGPVLAINKPAGLLTQGPYMANFSLAHHVRQYLKRLYQKPGNVYLGIPHRLDRAVTGVVLFTRNTKAASRLAEQFRDRQVRKVYWAVLEQPPDPPGGTLVDWIEKSGDEASGRVATRQSPATREAILRYRTIETIPAGALVEVELHTGRFHQIRIQFSHRGWPVVGDKLYGATRELYRADDLAPFASEPPIALHARSLSFYHPIRYDLLTVTAPLPGYWRQFVFRTVGSDVFRPLHRPMGRCGMTRTALLAPT